MSKACMVTLGVDLSGQQDILSLDIVRTEKAAEWMAILEGLRQRGVRDVFFLCSDNLPGLDKAIEAIYPESIRQICIVHQIRNSLKYVSYKERKKMAADIKGIYRADGQREAKRALEAFREQWHGKYARAVESWENNWDNLTAFLEYPHEIRKLIYTTNIIESFNASLRKYTRNKKVLPNDDAAIKSIYLAAMAIRRKWHKSRFNWPQIHNQLYIHFKERMSL
ncbi:IS256 family transposase [Maribacter sp. 2307ULW6-5]|uniref:IS256 family transposase n=1 Tax=Maribacter sp. 2307ULW6-5 TaxID=3386275 RepID=UPI0039BCFDBD